MTQDHPFPTSATTGDPLDDTVDLLRDPGPRNVVIRARNRRPASAPIEHRERFEPEAGTSRLGWDGVGVVLVDIDGFRRINHTFGPAAGDRVLMHVARALRRCLRPQDTLVRWGGDEFLLLLAGADPGQTGALAERVARALLGELCEVRPQECLALSCSVGWSHVDWQESGREPVESAVAAAHAALYRARRERPGSARASLRPDAELTQILMNA
ncbi:MAG: GGDEF domain-containing protein [Acidobacteriota bacterium]